MAFSNVTYWACNVCGTTGPEFEGTAEDVLPKGWWTGDLKCPTASYDVLRADVAICPDCANG